MTSIATKIPAELTRRVNAAIAQYPLERKRSAALPLLHLWQEYFGFISDDGIHWIADKLELQPINILELVTFYPMLRQKNAAKSHVRVCRTLSCAMAGSYRIMENLCATAGITRGHNGIHDPVLVSKDGKVTVEFVECLASCGTAPVCMVNDELRENVDPNMVADLFLNQTPVTPKPGEGGLNRNHQTSPHHLERRLVFKNIGRPDWTTDIDCYLDDGGYQQLKKAVTMSGADILNEVKTSALRGRGGAGFPTGVKWSFIKPDEKKPVYLICNADESEPGTFKDRSILHQDPHQLLEGILISCYALNVHTAYIYIRGEFPEGAKIVERAIEEAREKKFLGKNILGSNFDVEVFIHRGAGAYICGEETGLIESLEGKRAYPRIKPPYFPAVLGLYLCPTIVNNVETLCAVKHIVAMGGAEYARLGTPNNTGTRIVSVSGHVKKPGYYEVEVGKVTRGELINDPAFGGGLRDGRTLKAVIPGGSSAKVFKAGEKFKLKRKGADGQMAAVEVDLLDLPYDFDSLAQAGSMSGSGAIIVMDDSTDMIEALANIAEFYAHESCGQCTPCREGSLWMSKALHRLTHGQGRASDADYLLRIADNIPGGRTICAFGEACAWPVQSFVAKFKDEFVARGAADEERRMKEISSPEKKRLEA